MTGCPPAFRLFDASGGEGRTVADLPPAGPIVDVAQQGAAGVISALTGGYGRICLVRDKAIPLTGHTGDGLWLQTSGTTGAPKWVSHDIETLMAPIAGGREKARWLLTYHPGSFAGVQVILSALKGGHDLVVPPLGAGMAEIAQWAVRYQVTHISATPTFWRGLLMGLAGDLPLRVATLGGEVADQGILDTLRTKFPKAVLKHIYATTETGVVFTVSDGQAGFPAVWLKDHDKSLSLTDSHTLCVNGVDTGDVIDIQGARALFRGRLDTVVNIGGAKIFPEALEAFLLQLPEVQNVRIGARPSPITGHVLVAEIVANPEATGIEQAVKDHLSQLPRMQRPALIRYVGELATTEAGKKART